MYNVIKRIIDFLFAFSALVILLPVFIPVVVALLLTGEHEVFYFQKRIGKNGNPFFIWKFATMLKNSEKIGTGTITLRNDPRVTVVGSFLRKTKINELPQIVNVLLGQMSIVGPRPLVEKGFNAYDSDIKIKIGKSKPGLTGIGSIVFRDEEFYLSQVDNHQEFYDNFIQPYKGNLELWYYKNKSLFVDFKLMALTAWIIFFPKSSLYEKFLKKLPSKPEWMLNKNV